MRRAAAVATAACCAGHLGLAAIVGAEIWRGFGILAAVAVAAIGMSAAMARRPPDHQPFTAATEDFRTRPGGTSK